MKKHKHIAVVLLCVFLTTCFCHAQPQKQRYDAYEIAATDEDAHDTKWAEYLRTQLNNRGIVVQNQQNSTPNQHILQIAIDLNPSLQYDYAVLRDNEHLTLCAKNENSMLWILYQFISWISQYDDRVDATDLTPPLLDLSQTCEGSFMFDYRGIYSPTNCDPDFMAVNASHNVDYDWGLWGHNLRKVVKETNDDSIFAWHEGKRDQQQLCFSSKTLYECIVRYITDNYGEGKTTAERGNEGIRFCIMPDDNDVVCLCELCRQAGNNSQSATPSVMNLLKKIAQRFPNHLFYTTAYRTTENPPSSPMPTNSGVIISAIDMPLAADGFNAGDAAEKFEKKIDKWKSITPHIYVWDYMRNFDDYLTPFPVMGILKERLALFKRLGVTGVFYNGSGYDYASLDDVQTYVLASMLKMDNIDPDSLTKRYLHKFYPQSGDIIYKYYGGIEQKVIQNHSKLEYYGGIIDAVDSYLNPVEFESFYKDLDAKSKNISGEERLRLNKLLTALNFTMLELSRIPQGIPYDTSRIGDWLYNLQGHDAFPEMKNYKEANGAIDTYIELWNKYGVHSAVNKNNSNRYDFKFYQKGNESREIKMLSDCFYGLPSDYHTGWYQFKDTEISAESEIDRNCIVVIDGGFLYAPKWKIDLPERVSILINDTQYHEIEIPSDPAPYTKQYVRFETKIASGDRLKIVVKPRETSNSFVACDEIEVYEKK